MSDRIPKAEKSAGKSSAGLPFEASTGVVASTEDVADVRDSKEMSPLDDAGESNPRASVGPRDNPFVRSVFASTHETSSGDPTDLPTGGVAEGEEAGVIEAKEEQEFFLPVTGFDWFTRQELDVINHPAFQRLAKVNQLGFAHVVFRGATHKRIEHVLGAVGLAERVVAAIARNGRNERTQLSASERTFVRLGALLHDIGHIAAGHTLEDELAVIGKHDEDERLFMVFNKTDWDVSGLGALAGKKALDQLPALSDTCRDSLADVINQSFKGDVPESLRDDVSASDIVWLLIRKPPYPDSEKDSIGKLRQDLAALPPQAGHAGGRKAGVLRKQIDLERKLARVKESGAIRFSVCANIIGNTICADLLDYISRDWFHVGKPLSVEDRIFQYMEIQEGKPAAPGEPSHPSDDRFVVALGKDTKIRRDGVSAILGLLERRYELAETVLYHKTKLAAGAVLDRALFEIADRKEPLDLVDDVLCLSDEQLIEYAIGKAFDFPRADDPRRRAALKLLGNLRMRILPKPLIAFDSSRHVDERQRLAGLYAPLPADQQSDFDPRITAANRAWTARTLERDFDFPAGSVAVSCAIVKPKIAKVAIRVNDCVQEFDQYEKGHKDKLSGGHLAAQVERFERLWRLDFFLNEAESKAQPKDVLDLMRDTVRYVIASTAEPDERYRQARRIAREYVEFRNAEQSAAALIKFEPEGLPLAAAGTPETAAMRYANGSQSISHFIGRAAQP